MTIEGRLRYAHRMLWVKAFHLVAVVCWFSGLFYLPRLFVYHAMSEDSVSHQRFIVMERKLFWGITTPSAAATVLLGFWLLLDGFQYYMALPWMHVKLALVALLLCHHGACWHYMRALRLGENKRSHLFFRVFNELPVLLLVAVVVLAVIEPRF